LKDLEPHNVGRRVLNALALLLAISFAAHEIAVWLAPLAPFIIGATTLAMVWAVVFGRRWK
jgi:hypothetical protein